MTETARITEFTIDRKTWSRGEGDYADVYLHREHDGKQCCLGFYSLACGLPLEAIKNVHQVADIQLSKVPEQMRWLVRPFGYGGREARNADEAITLMADNDSRLEEESDAPIAEEDREQNIAAKFANQGITVKFIN